MNSKPSGIEFLPQMGVGGMTMGGDSLSGQQPYLFAPYTFKYYSVLSHNSHY